MTTEFRPTAEEIPAQTLAYPASQAERSCWHRIGTIFKFDRGKRS
jgi:hypothetical protein